MGSARALAAIVVAAGMTLAAADARSHVGHDHGAPPAPSSISTPRESRSGFAAEGTAFQIVLVPADDGGTIAYLADIDTNAPIAGADIQADVPGWQGRASPTTAEGIYRLGWVPAAQPTDVTLLVSADGREDLLLVSGVAVRSATSPAASTPAAKPGFAAGLAYGALGVVAIGFTAFALLRRRHGGRAAAASCLMFMVAATALAHEGHDHGPPLPAAPAFHGGASVVMPKATQFLLDIRTLRVEPREVADSVRVVGRVVPDPAGYARVQSSQVARVVADPNFPLPVTGQTVVRGQPIAVLEPTLTSLERSEQRAALYRVQSEIAIQSRELLRLESLGAIVPAKSVENTRIRLDQLRREEAQIAGTALGREVVKAPLDGIVTDVHVVPGEVVTPEKVLVEIVDPDRLRIDAVIYDLSVADGVSAATASSKLIPNEIFNLGLLGISPRIDPNDQGVHAVFAVATNQARRLKLGLPVDVWVSTGARRLSMAVPREAVAEVNGRRFVFVRTAPETFVARPVAVLQMVGGYAEVEGVEPGDRVVVQGVEQLKAAQ